MANEGGRFQPRRAIRFVFEYEGDELRLVAQQAVDMVVPDALVSSDAPGYYLDARDPGERTLARVAAPAAFGNNMEVFPERHDEPIARINTPGRRSAFTVTLPSVDEADHVTMVRVDAAAGSGADRTRARVVDIASFRLNPDRGQ